MSNKKFLGDRPPVMERIVKKALAEKALKNERKYDIFHPSAWGSCLRKVAYQWYNERSNFLKKTDKNVDARMQRIYDNGHAVHARWQNYFDLAGVLRGWWRCTNPTCKKVYGGEVPYGIFNPSRTSGWACDCGSKEPLVYEEVLVKSDPRYNFEGHVDSIIDVRGTEFEQHNKYDVSVVDIKTIKSSYFEELGHGPHQEYVVQVNIYMWILGLEGASILYECKDDQKLIQHFVPRDDELIAKVKGEAEWLNDVLKSGKLPPRQPGFTQSQIPCYFCEFSSHCYR